jgi:hypothetical protein
MWRMSPNLKNSTFFFINDHRSPSSTPRISSSRPVCIDRYHIKIVSCCNKKIITHNLFRSSLQKIHFYDIVFYLKGWDESQPTRRQLMRALILFLFFAICLPAFGQTTFTTSPSSPSTALTKGVLSQEIARFVLNSSTGATWNRAAMRFNKIVPSNPWNSGNIDTYLTNIRIEDGSGKRGGK